MTMEPFEEKDIEQFNKEIEQVSEIAQKRVIGKITLESERLVDELLIIIYNNDLDDENRPVVDPRVKLSAIGMLLDRAIPKKGVDSNKPEIVEESKTRKRIREEISQMMQEDRDNQQE